MAAIDIALGSVEKIIKVAAEIKKAVETAKRNREEVVDIQERVETVEHIVLVLDETDVTMNLAMDRALENLHMALHRALELIKDSEKKNKVCLLCTARDLSKQLLRVQDDISHKLMQVTLAITIHITIEMGKKANPPRRRRQRPNCRVSHRPKDKMQHAATAVQATVRMGRRARVQTIGNQGEGCPDSKFRYWDEDLSSGDDFTVIFNKCRDDKKMTDPGAHIPRGKSRDTHRSRTSGYRPDFESSSDGDNYRLPKHRKAMMRIGRSSSPTRRPESATWCAVKQRPFVPADSGSRARSPTTPVPVHQSGASSQLSGPTQPPSPATSEEALSSLLPSPGWLSSPDLLQSECCMSPPPTLGRLSSTDLLQPLGWGDGQSTSFKTTINIQDKGQAVPKFGNWNMENPASDEVIFSDIKLEHGSSYAVPRIRDRIRKEDMTIGPSGSGGSSYAARRIRHRIRIEDMTIGPSGSGDILPLPASRKSNVTGDGDGGCRADFKSGSNGKHGKILEASSATLSGLKMFGVSELNAATNSFSDDRVIGEGNYSTVYKGVMHDGLVVALKVLLDSHLKGSQMRLLGEINIGAKLKHRNVVRYLGYCMDITTELLETRTHVLVLDYLPNGSLGDVVKGEKLIEWSSCFRIIHEIAQGVHYLHEQHIIHGDLKPDNILFDAHMNPVIIDFGKSVILDPDVDEEILDCPVGTLGYMAPETYESCRLSMKSDVFAFGVCLVRTVIFLSTGRSDWYDAQDWKKTLQNAGGMKGLLLPKLKVDKTQLMEINRYLEVGWRCTEMDPAKRPTMADVIQMLSGEKELPVQKNQRSKGMRP